MVATENRTKRWSIAIEFLLFGNIWNMSIHTKISEKIRLYTFNYRTLCHALYIRAGSFISNHLAAIIRLYVTWNNARSIVDMQMAYGHTFC